MSVFRDKTGYEWRVEIDFGVVLDWKAECSLDLGDAEQAVGKIARVLAVEPFAMADLLWIACRDQAQEKGFKREEFIRQLPSDTDSLRDLLSEGVLLFFLGKKRAAELLPKLQELLRGAPNLNGSDSSLAESSESIPGG